MNITVHFHSYFKDLAGCAEVAAEMPEGSSLADLLQKMRTSFPKLEPMRRSTLAAVGVDYQSAEYRLKEGDEVSLFPPVQGG